MTEADAAYQQGYDRGMALMDAIVDEMREAGWPGCEVRRYGGDWMATFFKYTPFSGCQVRAIGRGSTISEALLKAKEVANAQHP